MGTRIRGLGLILASCLAIVACGPTAVPGGDGGTGGIADSGPDRIDAGGGTSDAGLSCTGGGTLCGTPAVCCESGMECAADQCLPACASGVRCGDQLSTCCAAGNVCLDGACTVPGEACADSYDCEPGHFCEPTLEQCLPQPEAACQHTPQFSTLSAAVEWDYQDHEIISIPVVANLDGQGAPEVVLNLTQQGGVNGDGFRSGRIVVLDGASGAVVLGPIDHDPPNSYASAGRSTIAVGDVSGDGLPDIIYAARGPDQEINTYPSLIVAMDHTGQVLWTSHDSGGNVYTIRVRNGGATLANFDDDPQAEIVFGATLIDNDGTVMWDAGGIDGSGGFYGSNGGYQGGISAVADLDGDGVPEIVSGKHAWKVAWGTAATPTVSSYWTYSGNDGYPAVADLDQDGSPEVILVASNQVMVLDGQQGTLLTPAISIPGGANDNRGGFPTVGDFDGDGRPEIGVAGGHSYAVYDLNRPDEVIPNGASPAQPAEGALFIRWSMATQDTSSNASGSSVFDFQGDGAAEVVYADECYMRVYSGVDGTVVYSEPSTNATIHEYPLVVDVDGDNNSEILIVANDSHSSTDCPGVTPRKGLYVYGDENDEWVPTRKVWTQHSYHVTNATSAGNVPLSEPNNWTEPGLNNYRQNVQGDGIFNAPDLAVDLSLALLDCGKGEIVLRARVTNLGALGVPQGIGVTFYAGTDASGEVLGTGQTEINLLPGQSTMVALSLPAPIGAASYHVVVDGGSSGGAILECDESNNTDGITEAGCYVVD